MKISAKMDYACRAVLELSLHWPNTAPLQIQTIAQRQDIPIKFLNQILIHLKQSGCVDSIRGKSGGYLLRNAPREIRLSDIIKNSGGLEPSAAHRHPVSPNMSRHALEGIWQELDDVVLEKLQGIDFEAICHRVRSQEKALIFEI